ncbi:hypothetical protein M406DRAFT_100998 [Cryphonectria parasitica EP155]|uniref:Uncharacterized protein n=1 Tax=Cryphonectria parasitica (strain ATCC 38755 / EP155) TaxID=660469 RepID=A0A9P4YD14_CRYP1|nr:uncharacterized protein M406DRAFT_100998 [Cryphonectria parasitica EP155]KAF3770815.1 hypothetical protein M406DRAFT_100998 [Cryphonectria parasitica EP155]
MTRQIAFEDAMGEEGMVLKAVFQALQNPRLSTQGKCSKELWGGTSFFKTGSPAAVFEFFPSMHTRVALYWDRGQIVGEVCTEIELDLVVPRGRCGSRATSDTKQTATDAESVPDQETCSCSQQINCSVPRTVISCTRMDAVCSRCLERLGLFLSKCDCLGVGCRKMWR